MSKVYIVIEQKKCGEVIGQPIVIGVFKRRKKAVKYIFDMWRDRIIDYVPGVNGYHTMRNNVHSTAYIKGFIIQ